MDYNSYKGCNVKLGKYGKGNQRGNNLRSGNGTYEQENVLAGHHRQSYGVARYKGHQWKGARDKR